MKKCLVLQKGDVLPTAEELDAIDSFRPNRNYRQHYQNVLDSHTAFRILGSRAISPDEVKEAFIQLRAAFQSWAEMGSLLTPYFHITIHMEPVFYLKGPMYAWWAFHSERNNGRLGKFNNNGHSGGEMEGTMMRAAWKSILIKRLVGPIALCRTVRKC